MSVISDIAYFAPSLTTFHHLRYEVDALMVLHILISKRFSVYGKLEYAEKNTFHPSRVFALKMRLIQCSALLLS